MIPVAGFIQQSDLCLVKVQVPERMDVGRLIASQSCHRVPVSCLSTLDRSVALRQLGRPDWTATTVDPAAQLQDRAALHERKRLDATFGTIAAHPRPEPGAEATRAA